MSQRGTGSPAVHGGEDVTAYGYFEIPRQATLEEIAEEMGIAKATASNHLRKVQRQLVEFLLPYINLAVQET
ncbi:helix-turn-helix domain-containing protein [Haladaptatus sp. DJG-WS-42]|uniref:helix-turn-helix domain-containing protein n=1 Tax=Haladaptatus sp. DJG-WS-42 TaxID=3120516 RepID=UPI0030D42337